MNALRNRRFLSLRTMVISGMVATTALLAGVIFYLTAIRFHRLAEGVMAERLNNQCNSAARLWERGVEADVIAAALMVDKAILGVSFHARGGMWRSFGNSEIVEQHTPPRVFRHPLETPEDSVTELGHAHGILHVEGHRLIAVANSDSGTVEITMTTARVNTAVAHLVGWGNRIIILVFLLTGVGVLLIDRRLRRILRRMIGTANQIATGQLEQRLQVQTGDALEELGDSFNRLAVALAGKKADVERAHAELASTIADRTAELRGERDRLSRILDNLPSAFILFDDKLDVQATSSAVGREVGIVFEAENEKRCHCTLPMSGATGCVVREAQQRGTAVMGRLAKTRLNGQQRIIEHSAFPVCEGPRIVGWLETITDVTDRESQQERLLRAERLSVAGELAATLAHEIRNHLTSAKLLLQIDVEAASLASAQREHLARVIESVRDMEQMVEELLAFARPTPVARTSVDMDELLRSAVDQVRPASEHAGVVLVAQNHVVHEIVQLDLNKMRRALVNLLLNALQVTPRGGRVQLTAAWENGLPAESVQPRGHGPKKDLTSQRTHIAFQVEDTGPGVPPLLREKIFEPFFTTRPSGVGLGLALVKQVALDHGGTIQVDESALGGARFKMMIPVRNAP